MKILIIIPAYNEEHNIARVLDNLIINYPQYDYIVINDGSQDNTKGVLLQNKYHFIDLPINLGIGGGVQTGYKYALDKDYDYAVQLDGDGQHDPQYIDFAISEIERQNADIAIGSRFIVKDGFQSSSMRRLGINFLSILIKRVCGVNIKDVTSGYRIVNKKIIQLFANDYAQDYPEPEAIVSAVMHGAKVIEVPVIMHERSSGTSSISPMKSMYYMIKVSLAILLYRITFTNLRGGNQS